MTAYLWPAPKRIAEAPIPEGGNAAMLHILRTLPADRAVILEFVSQEHLSGGRNVLQTLAWKELGFRLRTHKLPDSAAPRLQIWRMDAEPAVRALPLLTTTVPMTWSSTITDWADPHNLI